MDNDDIQKPVSYIMACHTEWLLISDFELIAK